ncbi:MAG: FAD-dependent 5-carboxymethylaminomethyl-2-thiouridine(34) oxidoreductase MnmC, partial [Burkholderiales bacterium]|nr:FAD-dependent 5-carboxymethylaminomethyl-2-thiouridine(34) oxidoreductase MnmC [Burkholderiales bacterium]
APGIGGKREITLARHEPRYRPARPADRRVTAAHGAAREAVVIGAGLAGACCARALADEGWSVRVFERRSGPAAETSGNAGGIFHGTVHGEDGPHARLLRAAALAAARTLRPLVDAGCIAGQVQGLLRLGGRELAAMQARVDHLGLPPEWVRALDADAASALAGVTLAQAAWFFPQGGWVSPAGFVQERLDHAGVAFCGETEVQALERGTHGWRLLDRNGRCLAETAVVILANAAEALRLAASQGYTAEWQRIRGQVSGWRGAAPLRLPLAGDGYALPLAGQGLLCGSTQSPGDDDPLPRAADDEVNLERLRRLCGLEPPPGSVPAHGRVGWRLVSADRMPVAGPLPLRSPEGRSDQVRHWPRIAGLYLCSALGGRGISLAPLLGRLLAAQIAGAPWPLEQGLVDAVDPARGLVRAARQQPSTQP